MTPAQLVASTLDEETARAEVYGLLAALYYAAPSAELHENLRAAVTEAPAAGALLEGPWSELVAAARAQSLADVGQEYDALFGGVGKPEVYLFGSHYLSGFLNEKPLAALRDDLAALGLARDEAMPETEDHVAYLCEVMRYLIAGDDVEVANLTRQRDFFARHVQPWVPMMCEAVMQSPKARFYRALAAFTQAFISVEAQGFDMLA
ncbi:TorD/DmsD family molecular chaperone [Polaromonas jejuensis]|uniref:Molecular chaperone n=1 Tax=Polaromonas jejuensis TaxID=457502 RepID=A0ABW0Q9X9_9BURK|nr:molecular chaperone TorD family protein [Polaromonas jejuensis]